MHPSSSWPTQDDRGLSIEAESLELCVAVFAIGRNLAHSDLVTHHLNWLLADYRITEMEGWVLWTGEVFFFVARYSGVSLSGPYIYIYTGCGAIGENVY